MANIIDQEFIARLNGIRFNLAAELKNNQLGKRRSKSLGSSVEFSDYRQYNYGDDFRRIDWNAYGRFEKLFIKRYMEEQEVPLFIFADYSKSMAFEEKNVALIKSIALFAFAQLSNYDSVAFCPFSDGKRSFFPPPKYRRGRAEFYKLAQELESQGFQGESDLFSAVERQLPLLKKGYTVILSDFLYEHKLAEILPMLNFKKQKIILIQILSPTELRPVFDRDVCLKDSETQTELNVQLSPLLFKHYQQQLEQYLLEIRSLVEKFHGSYFLLDSSIAIEQFIAELGKSSFGGRYGR